MCGNCEFFDAHSGECKWSDPVPSVWQIESVYTSFYEGTDCQTFKKREPEIVPATIDDVTGGPWNPEPPPEATSEVIRSNPDVLYTFTGTNLKVECKTCGQTVNSNCAHHCPGGRILTDADVRRIVREELADIERSKPTTDNP